MHIKGLDGNGRTKGHHLLLTAKGIRPKFDGDDDDGRISKEDGEDVCVGLEMAEGI